MKTPSPRLRPAFTLVELLVVIAIIATLALLSFLFAGRAKDKAKAARAMENIRQVGVLVIGYASENGGKLPALRGYSEADNTNWHWNQLAASLQFPNAEKNSIMNDKTWWKTNTPLVMNPQMPDTLFQTYYSGYAMNLFISENHLTAIGAERDWESILRHETPLAALREPERTPLIVPHWNWHTGDLLSGTKLNDINKSKYFLNAGKTGVLFADGHAESLDFATPDGKPLPVCEYAKRGLDKMPAF